MIRRLPVVLTAATLLGAAQPALAKDAISHSYWDAAYLNSQVESDSSPDTFDFEGFGVGASLGLAKFLNFTGDYTQRRDHQLRHGFGSAGLAYHTQHPEYQFFGGVSYERVEFDNNANPATDAEEDGFGVELGGRYMFPNVEVHAAYRYLDFGSVDRSDPEIDFTGARYGAGFDVQLSGWWSLVADYTVREHKFEDSSGSATVDYNEFSVGFRHYFASDPDRKVRHGGILGELFSGGEGEAAAE